MTLQELSIIFFFGFLVFVGIVAYFSSKQKASGVSADVEYYLLLLAPTYKLLYFFLVHHNNIFVYYMIRKKKLPVNKQELK